MRDAYEVFVGKVVKGQGKYWTFIINLKDIGRSSIDWIELAHDLDHC
jgi:hypothetical protein